MNILEKIIEQKKIEVAKNKVLHPVEILSANEWFGRKTLSLKTFLQDKNKTGIIAEFKRRSPSKGVINDTSAVAAVTAAYTTNGASCLSILTDEQFFGGSNQDLLEARFNEIPILRKDFIIDEYQLTEAKAIGGDVILLIAACLSVKRTQELASFAKQLQMEVLLEIHTEEELKHICDEVDIVGVNNRNLKTFSVDVNKSIELGNMIGKIKIAESGINSVGMIHRFRDAGFSGYLMGELFMKEADPGEAFKDFVCRHYELPRALRRDMKIDT